MSPNRTLCAALLAAACTLATTTPAVAVTATGRLQIIHLDVGQGDGAVIISPLGQVVMIDDGVGGNPTPASGVKVPQQLQALGVTHVDHHFASHYHSDHIGLFGTIFGAGGVATVDYGWDRGGSYSTSYYTNYVSTLGSRRRTLVKGQVITLDSLSAHPVTITCVDLNGAGVPTSDENSSSVQLRLSYGEFDMSFGGDTPGQNSGSYANVETPEAPEMGPIEVYKVHHHGSATSSLTDWLNATHPKVAVVSEGTGNPYGHPTSAAMTRLHNAGVHVYWTETGSGVAPNPTWDKVSNGQIAISATWEPNGVDTIRGNGFIDTFTNSGPVAPDVTAPIVNLTAPDGGETWKVGSAHPITWSATDDVAVSSVDLAWSIDGGATWTSIVSGIANVGAYTWTVPAAAAGSTRVRARARDAAGNLAADSSAAAFTVDWWTIAASSGAGGTISPSGTVNVSQGASRSFTIAPLAGCQVTDVNVDGASVGAVTGYLFPAVTANHTIAASFIDVTAPAVALTSPVGGEDWLPGGAYDITWSASDNLGVDSVDVDCSLHGPGGPWVAVAHGLANSGTYTWTVPGVSSDSALVRVTAFDHALQTAAAISDSLFRIGVPSAAVGDRGPTALALARPAPNPSAGLARLRFSLPHDGAVRLDILDLSGRRVAHLEGAFPAGQHEWAWDGRSDAGASAGAGLYFVRLGTPWGTRIERLVRLR